MTMNLNTRVVAKFATRCIVHSAVAQASVATMNQLADTDPDTSNEAIEIGGSVIGFVVSLKLRPHTDRMVDRVADWNIDRKLKNIKDIPPFVQ